MNHSENEQMQGEEAKSDSPGWGPEQWAERCSGTANAGCSCFGPQANPGAMAQCFRFCRYFLLFPLILGAAFLLTGYFLSPDKIRVLWMVGAGMVATMGLLVVLFMRRFTQGSSFAGCCGAWPKQQGNGGIKNATRNE